MAGFFDFFRMAWGWLSRPAGTPTPAGGPLCGTVAMRPTLGGTAAMRPVFGGTVSMEVCDDC